MTSDAKASETPVDTFDMRYVSKMYQEGSKPEQYLFNGANEIDELREKLSAATSRAAADAEDAAAMAFVKKYCLEITRWAATGDPDHDWVSGWCVTGGGIHGKIMYDKDLNRAIHLCVDAIKAARESSHGK